MHFRRLPSVACTYVYKVIVRDVRYVYCELDSLLATASMRLPDPILSLASLYHLLLSFATQSNPSLPV
jgi:hypothetical protein